jgi:ferritin-like metal-binding protein YciE
MHLRAAFLTAGSRRRLSITIYDEVERFCLPEASCGSDTPHLEAGTWRRRDHSKPGGALRGFPLSRRDKAMGFFSKDIKTLDDLFVHTLRDIYYAEKQIVEALPKMIEKATAPDLKAGFEKHLRETEGHVQRVEKVFDMHGAEAKEVNCPAIDGILEEAGEVSGEVEDKKVLDAALIASAQAVEHYEITRYGTLIAWAKQLGREDCASVLAQNLQEEEATDKKLSGLAERRVNREAA